MSPLVSIVMPCYRDADLVEHTVPRILGHSRVELELVLVNNDSKQSDQLHALVSRLEDDRVRVLEVEHGAGFARAINAGIHHTEGDLVFFANSDLFVASGYLDEIVSLFDRRSRAGCATGKILRYDVVRRRETDVIDTSGLTIGRNRRVADRGENSADRGQFEREEEVFGASGAALVARREALESIRIGREYLDESFHMYKEDIDLCWRFRLAGWECWYVPSAVAYHARTVHGTGRRSYLAHVKRYHENEQRKPVAVRMNSMRNHWLLLLKNEDAANFARDAPWIVGREALILGYNVVFSPVETGRALRRGVRSVPAARAKRSVIKRRQTVTPSEVRRWFTSRAGQ